MKRRKLIKTILAGIGLLLLILVDINLNWWWRGYPAFGGEGLLYILVVSYYVYYLIEVIKS